MIGRMDDPQTQNDEKPILSGQVRKNTSDRVRVFLNTYAETADVKAAATAAGIHRSRHYQRLQVDPVYAKAFEGMQRQVGETIEAAAVSRVLHGVKRQLFYKGKPIRQNGRLVYEVVYDSHLTHVLLKRFLPTEYREHVSAEISGTINLVDRMTAAVERVRLLRREPTERAG